jgi:RHS repeat-associated protein
MNGGSSTYALWPTPGAGTLWYTGNTFYMHKDWLGSPRIISNISAGTVFTDRAYAPYGEPYLNFGGTGIATYGFAGLSQGIVSGMYDTENREFDGVRSGRWFSPDPTDASWNKYAYPTNPNSFVDPTGLNASKGDGLRGTGQAFFDAWGFGITQGEDDPQDEFDCGYICQHSGLGDAYDRAQRDYAEAIAFSMMSVQWVNPNNGQVVSPGAAAELGYMAPAIAVLPSWTCRIPIFCDPFELGQNQVYKSNKSSDKTMYKISEQFMWDSSNPGSLLWAQINDLEKYNLVIDSVALGQASMSMLEQIPVLDISSPPGISDTVDKGIDYFEEVRDQNNVKIDEFIQQLAALQHQHQ